MADMDPGLAPVTEGASQAASDPQAPGADTDRTTFTGLRDEVSALVEDARTYAEAEIAFQKTRARLTVKGAARAALLLVLALVLLNLALIALAVGAVIALAPLVTIWGAIAIVVGVLLLGVALLVAGAARQGKVIGALFAPEDEA